MAKARKCAVCGASLEGKRAGSVYCGDTCRAKAYRQRKQKAEPYRVVIVRMGEDARTLKRMTRARGAARTRVINDVATAVSESLRGLL